MSRSFFKKAATISLLVICIFLAICGALLSIYSIDNKITVGERYGFVVGESITTVAEKIRTQPRPIDWPIAVCAYGESRYDSFEADQFYDMNVIECKYVILIRAPGDLAIDGVRLEFSENSLASIYRYRKIFEFP